MEFLESFIGKFDGAEGWQQIGGLEYGSIRVFLDLHTTEVPRSVSKLIVQHRTWLHCCWGATIDRVRLYKIS